MNCLGIHSLVSYRKQNFTTIHYAVKFNITYKIKFKPEAYGSLTDSETLFKSFH